MLIWALYETGITSTWHVASLCSASRSPSGRLWVCPLRARLACPSESWGEGSGEWADIPGQWLNFTVAQFPNLHRGSSELSSTSRAWSVTLQWRWIMAPMVHSIEPQTINVSWRHRPNKEGDHLWLTNGVWVYGQSQYNSTPAMFIINPGDPEPLPVP